VRQRLQAIMRWDPPLWLRLAVGIAVFVVALNWPIAGLVVVVLAIPFIVLGVREKQRRSREGL
jgi:chromate transport protein ChrA